MDQNIRNELIRRHKRDAIATLAALDREALWHPLDKSTYRAMLLDSLEEHDQELAEIEGETWPED